LSLLLKSPSAGRKCRSLNHNPFTLWIKIW
jgi:hypothetical protein